ncbi:MAG: hypothetical protein ABI359_09145 [Ginsengibacter sp.]
MSNKYLLVSLLLFFGKSGISQNKIISLSDYSKYNGLVYNAPKDFIETIPDNNYREGNDFILSSFQNELTDEKGDIIIDFTYFDLSRMTDSLMHIQRYKSKSTTMNLSFLRGIEIESDIENEKLLFLSNNEADEYYNADNVVIYKLNNENAYKRKYKFCKVVLLHKKDKADVYMYFWYDARSKNKVDEVIDQTRNMLRFKTS